MTSTVESQRSTRRTGKTPDWLLDREIAMCPCGCIGKRNKRSYLEKTLRGGSDLLKHVMFSEDIAREHGLLQRIDPRVKLGSLVLLLITAALLHNIAALAVMYAASLVLASTSSLPLGFFVKRVWLFIPIFTGIVVLPATLSVVTSGDVVLTLWTSNGYPQGFTSQGLRAAGLIISRVAVSISFVVLLTVTTPWTRLLAALRGIGAPRIFVLVTGMAYRYIFYLLESVEDMYQARKARSVGRQRHDRQARRFVSATAGALISKSTHLSEEVHQAMTARGYRGDAKTVQAFRLRALDAYVVLAVVAFAALILMGDHLLGR